MQAKKKTCAGCNQEKYIWKADGRLKYCKECWYRTGVAKQPTIKSKPIRQRSKKKTSLDSVYTEMRKSFMEKHPMCQAKLNKCSINSTDVHHKKGRGPSYLDVTTWLSVCRTCHIYIEEHPKEAIELGLSIKRN